MTCGSMVRKTELGYADSNNGH